MSATSSSPPTTTATTTATPTATTTTTPSVSTSTGDTGISSVVIIIVISLILAASAALSIDTSPETANLLNQYKDLFLTICLISILVAIAIFSMYGFIFRYQTAPMTAFMIINVVFVLLAIVLSIFSKSAMFGSSFGTFAFAILLIAAFLGIFSGSAIPGDTGIALYYGSVITVIIVLAIYLLTSGNPEMSLAVGNPNSIGGASYLYRSVQTQSQVALKRTIYDNVYLSIAYPTLGDTDKQPFHNSQEFSGSHYLSNYITNLNRGGNAFLFDIYNEWNTSSPNYLSWRIGTINTGTGVVQNRRTISLRSVLQKTTDAINMNKQNGRTIFLFLNPRYTSEQLKRRRDYENQLAKDIRELIPYINLPSIAAGSNAESLGNIPFDQARNQVIILIGGTESDIISDTLKRSVHGRVNLTQAFVINTGAGNENAIAYTPGQAPGTNMTGAGSVIPGAILVAGVNRGNDLLAGYDKTSNSLHMLVGTLPVTRDSNIAYSDKELAPYIRFSASFPFVYTTAFGNYRENEGFFNGFGPIVSPQYVRSMIFSNIDDVKMGDTNPYKQKVDETKRCSTDKGGILNPINDSEWNIIFEGSSPRMSKINWCDNWNKDIRVNDVNMGRLVLYQMSPGPGQNGHSGIIPKPLLVDTATGERRGAGVYQIRKNVSISEVKSQTLQG